MFRKMAYIPLLHPIINHSFPPPLYHHQVILVDKYRLKIIFALPHLSIILIIKSR
jgi:hypothetical protein